MTRDNLPETPGVQGTSPTKLPKTPWNVSLGNVAIVVAVGLALVLLWQLRSLVVVLMVAIVIAATLAPIIRWGERFGPRWAAVIFAYLGLIAIITGLGLIIGPTIVEQIQILFTKLPSYLDSLNQALQTLMVRFGLSESTALETLNQVFDLQSVVSWAFRSSQKLLLRSYGLTRGILGGTFTVLLGLLLSAYLLSGSEKLITSVVNLFPVPWNQRLAAQVRPVAERMGGYIQGRILVSAILGLTITISLRFLGISELALGLGTIAGVTNLIPFFGPVLGSIPALIVAIAQGGWTFLWVLLLFVIVQNLETYLLDPLLVGSSVKVIPLYQLLAVLGGAQVLGILGALIVPPWVAGAAVVLENLYLHPKLLREQQALTADPPPTPHPR